MIERKILIALITQNEFIRQIRSEFKPEFLESATAKILANWCFEFYDKHQRAPMHDIENIYIKKLRRKNIDKELAEEIEQEILPSLSEEYEKGELNVTFLLEEARAYFKERQITIHKEHLESLLNKNKVDEAESAIKDFKLISESPKEEIDLSSTDVLNKLESAFDATYQNVIRFPGALGDFWNDQLVRGGLVALLAPEKRGKCLPGNQKILLASGKYMTISDAIKNNKRKVISFNEKTQKFIKTKISKFWKNGVKPVYEVTTKTGRKVQVTKNHPFLTPDGWKDLYEIGIGTFIAVPKLIPFFGKRNLPDYKIKLLAYFIADGCTLEYTYDYAKYDVVNYTKKEKKIQIDFSKCVKKMNGTTKWKGITCSVNKNKDVLQFLKDVGLWNKKSYQKTIPDIVYTLNKEGLRLFLKTLFTGDGWVNDVLSTDFQIGYSSTNKEMVQQVQGLLLKFGIVSKISMQKTTHRDSWSLTIVDYRNTKLFVDEIGFLFGKQEKLQKAFIGRKVIYRSFLDKLPWQEAKKFHDEAKQENATFKKASSIREQIVKKKPLMFQSFSEVEHTKTGQKYFNSEILWDEIISVDYIGKMETFDLTIEKHHNFIAENILVHNTFFLLEFMMKAYRQKRKVVFFQAGDMTENQMLLRLAIYLAKKSNKEKYCGVRYIPIQDCIHNQLDTCDKKVRECNFGIFTDDAQTVKEETKFKDLIELYNEHPRYKSCFNCPEWKTNSWGVPWIKKVEIEKPLSLKEAKRHWQRFFIRTKRKIKVSTHVNGTLTVSKIKSLLQKWKLEEDYVPDVIIIDYADLLEPEKKMEFRHQQNQIWKDLRSLSQIDDCLVITATQADADSYKRGRLGLDNYSEDKRKYAHVTAMYGLNQDVSGREKEIGIMRINKIVVREDDFHQSHEVNVLQRLEIGRPFLGSYL